MGLASFNRMRRERAQVEKVEAERFKRWNEARHKSRDAQDKAREKNEKEVATVRKEELAAAERIGEKVRIAVESGGKNDPLQRDHAAEIVGRNLEGVQTPKDPVERIDERIPQHETANEKLVGTLKADGKGPSKALLKAARREAGIEGSPEREVAPHDTPAETTETVPAADAEGNLGKLQEDAPPPKKAARKRARRKKAAK